MMNSATTTKNLRVERGGRAVLPGLDLEITAGSVTGLLGPSGSGKTTLMRTIAGVQRVAGGEVTVLGHPAGHPALRRQVGYVTQAPSVYGDLTARENLSYFAAVLGADGDVVATALETVALTALADRPVSTLSGGERARVSLAAALLGEPRLLVLDEPTVGLDPVLRRDLWRTFRALAEGGTTLLVSTHVMDEAQHCDEVVLMRDGAVIGTGSPGALMERTGTHDIESAFLALLDGELVPA